MATEDQEAVWNDIFLCLSGMSLVLQDRISLFMRLRVPQASVTEIEQNLVMHPSFKSKLMAGLVVWRQCAGGENIAAFAKLIAGLRAEQLNLAAGKSDSRRYMI